MSAPIAFIDTETTGLDPDFHEIWEVGLIINTETEWCVPPNGRTVVRTGWQEIRWLLPVSLARADPKALEIGGFHQRHPQGLDSFKADWPAWTETTLRFKHWIGEMQIPGLITPERARKMRAEVAQDIATFLRPVNGEKVHLVGAVTSFDEERLRKLLKGHGSLPEWHYHLVDVENLAVGYLMGHPGPPAVEIGSGVHPSIIETCTPPWDSNELSRTIGVNPDSFERHTALGDARWAKAIYDAVIHS